MINASCSPFRGLARGRRTTRRAIGGLALAAALVATGFGAAPAQADHASSTLTLSPQVDRNPLMTIHSVRARVDSPDAEPQPRKIHFEVTHGPNKGAALPSCTVDPPFPATCTTSYADARAQNGQTDTIAAWVLHDRLDPNEDPLGENRFPDAVAHKTWGGQLRPAMNPHIAGLVERDGRRCNTNRIRRQGRVAAVRTTCVSRLAVGEPTLYSQIFVYWLQTSLKARKGFCATRVRSDLRIPRDTFVPYSAPQAPMPRANQRRVGRAMLSFPAFAEEVDVFQTFYVPPGRGMSVNFAELNSGHVHRQVSHGQGTRKPIALAHGFAFEWLDPFAAPRFPPPIQGGQKLVQRGKCPR